MRKLALAVTVTLLVVSARQPSIDQGPALTALEESGGRFSLVVELGGDQVTNQVLEKMHEPLRVLNNMRSLVLIGAAIDDDGLVNLMDLTQLESLDLGATRVKGQGLRDLSGLPKLGELKLVASAVDNDGLESLKYLPKLQFLLLDGTSIDDRALEHIKGLKELREVSLISTKVTKSGAEDLRRSLPRTHVSWSE